MRGSEGADMLRRGKERHETFRAAPATEPPACRERIGPLEHIRVKMESTTMVNVQIFGMKNSAAVRAAERFFKERRIPIHFVDLKQKPMSPGEIKRFIDRFGLTDLIDADGKVYADAGLKYMKLTDADVLARIEKEPRLLRLPLVRSGNQLSVGANEDAWKAMLTTK